MPRYTEEEAREAIRTSFNYTEALRKVGLRPAGGNHKLFRHYVDEVWQIPTDHFDRERSLRLWSKGRTTPLEEVLVEHSNYNRAQLKRRLYEAGLKERRCELCGQGEVWQGRHMGLILDHVNGVPDDNRIENLRIVCPNCNATLETHCGRHNRHPVEPRLCLHCGESFIARFPRQRYCSRICGRRSREALGPHPERRKVERPPYEQLMAELAASNWSAVGRKYGVSANAVRNWVRCYEADAERRGGAAEREEGGPGDSAGK